MQTEKTYEVRIKAGNDFPIDPEGAEEDLVVRVTSRSDSDNIRFTVTGARDRMLVSMLLEGYEADQLTDALQGAIDDATNAVTPITPT
jgi:hypothetical protein